MKQLVSSTQPTVLFSGSIADPLDVIIQNVSANTIYVSLDEVANINNNGLRILPGMTYLNDYLTRTLYVLSDVTGSEIRYEVQKCKK